MIGPQVFSGVGTPPEQDKSLITLARFICLNEGQQRVLLTASDPRGVKILVAFGVVREDNNLFKACFLCR